MKTKEIRALSTPERTTKLDELHKELMKLKAQSRTTTPKNPGSIRAIKRTIAQIKTINHQQPTEAQKTP